MELLIGGEFLTHLSLVNSKKDILLDILLDIPRDMYPFSVFGSCRMEGVERSEDILFTYHYAN